MDRGQSGGGEVIDDEIAVADGVEAVGGRAVETQRLRRRIAVDREAGPGQRGRAQRAFVHPRAGVGEAAAVAGEHRLIGHQMVAERHRLARLQMGEAGHDRRGMFFGAGQQHLFEGVDPLERLVDRRAHEQFEIGRDLVVARAGGVEAAGGRADQLAEAMLDMHVNVFERRVFGELARFIFLGDRREPLVDLRRRPRARGRRSAQASRRGRGSPPDPRATAACRSRSRHLSRASHRRDHRRTVRPTSGWSCLCG